MYNFGTIVLIPFPFTDLSSSKLRPALIVSKKNNSEDIIVAFISSNINEKGNGIFLDQKDAVFEASGLKNSSVIRLDKIATLDKKIILGELGSLPLDFLKKYRDQFFDGFGF